MCMDKMNQRVLWGHPLIRSLTDYSLKDVQLQEIVTIFAVKKAVVWCVYLFFPPPLGPRVPFNFCWLAIWSTVAGHSIFT